MRLAGPLERRPGPAALFEGGPPDKGPGCWAARRALFGLPGIASNALAGGWGGRWGRVNAGLHVLEAGEYRERQVLLRWAPVRADSEGFDGALGLEARQASATGWRRGGTRWLGDAAWRQGPLALQARLALPGGALAARRAPESAQGQSLALGWELGGGWGLTWRLERDGVRQGEQAALALRRGDWALAAAWLPGRGWSAAARARWRGLALSFSWLVHPVLPPTPAWSVEWRGARP